jgi:ribonuclease VapC
VIAVDTSALMAILFDEPSPETCTAVMADAAHLLISAGTLAEARIVADRRGPCLSAIGQGCTPG